MSVQLEVSELERAWFEGRSASVRGTRPALMAQRPDGDRPPLTGHGQGVPRHRVTRRRDLGVVAAKVPLRLRRLQGLIMMEGATVGPGSEAVACPGCQGHGRCALDLEPCPLCKGFGFVPDALETWFHCNSHEVVAA